ncbi:MAG TPA: sigma-54 dependent transcriptional regulator [Symbiobacteriaceae bacterium]|nr:sigma-54 dependent transcriptional regulator [Symbiobacteriaceae bacterium]
MSEPEAISLLLVDDDDAFRHVLAGRLTRQGFRVTPVESGEKALTVLAAQQFDVVLLDLALPGIDGVEVLQRAKEAYPNVEIVMFTGHGSIETAIEATRAGAYDYLTKPCPVSKLELTLRKAAEKRGLAKQAAGLSMAQWRQYGSQPIIGQGPAMRHVTEMIRRIANGSAPVLITGESGTGKDLVARSLHFWSHRHEKPYQTLNSAALPQQLLESELFGHVKGAFTGAVAAKPGLVESADGGTLFLDELGEMDLGVQAKLLRFLESGEFRRVGEVRNRSVSVRIVAATNRPIEQEVASKRFREDLYYRLNVVRIHLPPLRERKEDIPLLAAYFLKAKGAARSGKDLSPESLKALVSYHYPGNVRELANLIERGLLLAQGPLIEPEDLFGWGWKQVEPEPTVAEVDDRLLAAVERKHIARVLRLCEGNKTQAARQLGIGLRTLYRKIDEYNLDHADLTQSEP